MVGGRIYVRMNQSMQLLLISNSTNAGEPYLEWPLQEIATFLKGVKRVLFVPYAGVTFSHDAYVEKVQKQFDKFGVQVEGIHTLLDPRAAVARAEAIVVGGGNTWRLLQLMQQADLVEAIRRRALEGVPYVGWSAGSNIACPTIKTTNDMPIVEPRGFDALGLVPFQINPHYLDAKPEGHGGESREDRIMEFIEVNPYSYVMGLREASLLEVRDGQIALRGKHPARIFHHGQLPQEVEPGESLAFLERQ